MYAYNMHLFVHFEEKAKQYYNTVRKYIEQLPIEELLLLLFALMHNNSTIADAQ